jgi:hypothetical protein
MEDQKTLIFNRVRDHLLTQKERSYDPNIGCLYRGPRGLKCAVGCLIKDEHYSRKLEDNSVDDERVLEALRRSGYSLTVQEIKLLSTLQRAHDENDPRNWPLELAKIKEQYEIC